MTRAGRLLVFIALAASCGEAEGPADDSCSSETPRCKPGFVCRLELDGEYRCVVAPRDASPDGMAPPDAGPVDAPGVVP